MIAGHSIVEVSVFFGIVIFCLWLDLHAHKADREVSAKDAALWSCLWVALAVSFAVYIGINEGWDKSELFIAGYLLEESLSVDNLFVMMAIFGSFAIKGTMQHRVLYYGILGAMLMRLAFVAAGASLVALFGPYALAGFGVFVLWTAFRMARSLGKEQEAIEDYSNHWAVRWVGRCIPVHDRLVGHSFFVRTEDGGHSWKATPLFLCLIVIEISDVMFAFDSVPAIIAVTSDPFLVYTSNIFAILGLRSMYFLLAAAKRYLRHLEKAVIVILAFIGVKMLLDVTGTVHISSGVSLLVVAGCLAVGISASLTPKPSDRNQNSQ